MSMMWLAFMWLGLIAIVVLSAGLLVTYRTQVLHFGRHPIHGLFVACLFLYGLLGKVANWPTRLSRARNYAGRHRPVPLIAVLAVPRRLWLKVGWSKFTSGVEVTIAWLLTITDRTRTWRGSKTATSNATASAVGSSSTSPDHTWKSFEMPAPTTGTSTKVPVSPGKS